MNPGTLGTQETQEPTTPQQSTPGGVAIPPSMQQAMNANKPKPTRSKKPLVIVAISILAVALIAGGSALAYSLLKSNTANDGLADQSQEEQNPLRQGVAEEKEFEKGTPATFGYFEVTVNQVTPDYKPTNGLLPSTKDYTFLLVNVTAKNTDQTPRLLSDFHFAVLNGDFVINTSLAQVDPALKNGAVEPGTSVTGNLLYEVPANATGLKLYYNTQIYNEEKQQLEKIEYTTPL